MVQGLRAVGLGDGRGDGGHKPVIIAGCLFVVWREVIIFLMGQAMLMAQIVGGLVQMQPELDNGHARIRQTGFQPPHAVQTGQKVAVRQLAAAMQPDSRSIPAPQKDPYLARCGQLAPVAPQGGTQTLFIRFHPEGIIVDVLAVHPFRQQIDHSPTTCPAQTSNGHQHRYLACQALTLRLKKAHAQGLHGLCVFLVITRAPQRGRLKHTYLLFGPGTPGTTIQPKLRPYGIPRLRQAQAKSMPPLSRS